ncbi:outer membrane protein TolC [Dysgonomonas hofstadii]|uniref:Outer membrane protein TolC n=1 Tax=Dysgonomonas hofstadii TaxID=637886 RepID=A0A840CJG9_9BACT|nr:TolC family protein [Dysgonomonas hofstadii]MBB4035506.1 outer membrane protein TolC [Dysgonomonas hofstadii]
MKKIIYITLLIVLPVTGLQSQYGFDPILKSIEINNTTLKAYREKADADKIGNRTGINLANPDVEVDYLWGNSSAEGKLDMSVKQTFDFPTAYRYKSQLADGKNRQIDMVYEQQRKDILQQARLICVEYTYLTKMNEQLVERRRRSKELAAAHAKRFELGEIDILEHNKAQLDMLNMAKAVDMNEVEIKLQWNELKRLNGGQPFPDNILDYPAYDLPLDYAEWFERIKDNNPSLLIAQQDIELSRKQMQLTKSLNLPKITAGYITEREAGVFSHGMSVGISIPLWEGRNTVKHQKAQTIAAQMIYSDSKNQFQNTLGSQYEKARKLSALLKEYKQILEVTNNYELLKKALDKGQLSLINYLTELSIYYDTMDKYLETERDYQMAVAELQQWEK